MTIAYPISGVMRTFVSEDATKVGIVMTTEIEGEHLCVGMPMDVLDKLIDALIFARTEAKHKGCPNPSTILLRPVSSWSTWAARLEAPGMVAVAFDPSLPTRVGFALPHQDARALAVALRAKARESVMAIMAPGARQ